MDGGQVSREHHAIQQSLQVTTFRDIFFCNIICSYFRVVEIEGGLVCTLSGRMVTRKKYPLGEPFFHKF